MEILKSIGWALLIALGFGALSLTFAIADHFHALIPFMASACFVLIVCLIHSFRMN